jgi:hypothetical protein
MASTPNECIVCLTNPRDVVLLPCRHLVVCRECAVGMIEFGAGGKVARREEASETTGATEGGDNGGAEAGPSGAAATGTTAAAAPTTTTGGRERRKKKGKGWFCPVCRQREWISPVYRLVGMYELKKLTLYSVHLVAPPGPTGERDDYRRNRRCHFRRSLASTIYRCRFSQVHATLVASIIESCDSA